MSTQQNPHKFIHILLADGFLLDNRPNSPGKVPEKNRRPILNCAIFFASTRKTFLTCDTSFKARKNLLPCKKKSFLIHREDFFSGERKSSDVWKGTLKLFFFPGRLVAQFSFLVPSKTTTVMTNLLHWLALISKGRNVCNSRVERISWNK